MTTRPTATGVLLALAACGAMPNPAPPRSPATGPVIEKSAPAEPRIDAKTTPGPSAGPQDPPGRPVASPEPAATSRSETADEPARSSSSLTIARVAGAEIDVAELLALWLHQDSLQVLEHLDHLVLGRLVLAEAARLSVRIDPEKSEKAYRDAVQVIEETIGKKRPGVTLDRYVDEALGLDPVKYREFLRDEALRGLLAERVVRAWVLSSERAEIRVIAVKSEEDSRRVADALATGEAFEDVARRLSADGSAQDGGRVPPVVRGDTPIARLSFQTDVGGVGGPQYEKGAWLFVKVEARPQPLSGDWKEISDAVERSLAERPVADLEVSQWKPVMVERYGVDVTPFMRLVE